MTTAERRHAVERARSRIGTPFDTLGMFGIDEQGRGLLLGARVVGVARRAAHRRPPHRITPADLMEYGEVVYWSGKRSDEQVDALATYRSERIVAPSCAERGREARVRRRDVVGIVDVVVPRRDEAGDRSGHRDAVIAFGVDARRDRADDRAGPRRRSRRDALSQRMPKPRSIAQVVAMRSDSLTRSSSASRTIVVPLRAPRAPRGSAARRSSAPRGRRRSRSRAARARRRGRRASRPARGRLAAIFERDLAAHRGDRVEKAGARWIDADVGQPDLARTRRRARRRRGTPTDDGSAGPRSRRRRAGDPSRVCRSSSSGLHGERRAEIREHPLGVIARSARARSRVVAPSA